MQHQFVAMQRQPQIIFNRQSFLRFGVKLVRKELVVVAALGFGVVHRHVGMLHQRFRVRAVGGVDADTNGT